MLKRVTVVVGGVVVTVAAWLWLLWHLSERDWEQMRWN